MPKYTTDIIAGYSLYFTSKCIIEAMHVHASDKRLSERESAKLFVYSNGEARVVDWGNVKKHEMRKIQEYIRLNYKNMYELWKSHGGGDFYGGR